MSKLQWLRYSALTEGVSWLMLLFFAMPMKYIWGDPSYVKVVGMAHGVLFMALVVLLLQTFMEERIDKREAMTVFLASFLPFGPFFTDKSLREFIAKEESVKEAATVKA
jgi:integral membrane protein